MEARRLLAAVTIDPGNYLGLYEAGMPGASQTYRGAQTLDLNAGTYRISMGGAGSFFQFDVDAVGNVTSQDQIPAGASGNTLSFNTAPIVINPGAFAGSYYMQGSFEWVNGPSSKDVVVGVRYAIAPNGASSGNLSFDVDGSGNVISNNPVSMSGNGNVVSFITTTINIDPVNYAGLYHMHGVSPIQFNLGLQSFAVLPGLTYRISPNGGSLPYHVDANGNVSSSLTDSLYGVGSTLYFRNTTIFVDTGEFLGQYHHRFGGSEFGSRAMVAVPGTDSSFQLRNGGQFILFNIDTSGNVISNSPDSAYGNGNSLVFKNSTLRIDPGQFSGPYDFAHVVPGHTLTGVQDVIVVPSQRYVLQVSGVSYVFNVGADCDPTPSLLPFAVGSSSFEFTLSCVTNTPPMITSPEAVEVDENSLSVLTLTAIDAEPDQTATFSITGSGPDDSLFTILPTGELGFTAPPDFETPLDANGDNVYEVEVKADDGNGGADTQTISVTVLNQASITGSVFVDVNANQLLDANELGIDGVVVQLLDVSGSPVLDEYGQAIETVTADGGFYLFEDLGPGEYRLGEVQPTGVNDGAEVLGTAGGVIVSNDVMQLSLTRLDVSDYYFAELGGQLSSGDAASIGFWQNKHGQALIESGGAALAGWLTANFGNVFGDTFSDGVADDGIEVAAFYKEQLFKQKAAKSAGPAKVDAQFMATALATYFTSSNLAGSTAVSYGFNVTDTGIGSKVVNVGSSGAAFGVADGTELTIMQLLLATNDMTDQPDSVSGAAKIYDLDGNGDIGDLEAELRQEANLVYSLINEMGGI